VREAWGERHAGAPPGRIMPLVCGVLLALALCSGCTAPRAALGEHPPPAGALVVSFIDVGQGDAILVQSGGRNYLVDGGRPEAGPEVVDFLRKSGVKRLDGLVATHPDADHVGGLPQVLDAFDVSTVYLSGDTSATTTFTTFLRGVKEEGARVVESRAGMHFDWGGTPVTVVGPPPDSEGGLFPEKNDNSVALLISRGAARILLAGDAGAEEERYMSLGPYAGPLTILKVDHHGSSYSTTPLFLSRFRPRVAVISVGADNPYGHPTRQTLRRLKVAGAKIFRTDEDGDVVATIKDDELEVAVSRP